MISSLGKQFKPPIAWMKWLRSEMLFLEVINKHAPLKCHSVKKKRQPDWITTEILDFMKERNKCKINAENF